MGSTNIYRSKEGCNCSFRFQLSRTKQEDQTLEEFGPDLQYIKDTHNVVADTLSHLPIDDDQEIFNISECFGYDDDDLPPSSFPLRYKDIAKAQRTNPALLLKLKNKSSYTETRNHLSWRQQRSQINLPQW